MTSPATATRPDRRSTARPAHPPRPARPPRPVEAAPRPRLRVVEPPTRRRVRPAFVVGLAAFVVFGALLAAAVVHSMLVSGQAHLDDVSTTTRVEREELERAQVRLASLQSPERITREAERLGMVPGSGDNWIQGDPQATGGPTAAVPEATVPEATVPEAGVAAPAGVRETPDAGGGSTADGRAEVAVTGAQVAR